MTLSAHLAVRISNTKGFAIAAIRIQPKNMTIDVMQIYLRYTCTKRSSSFCILARIGNVTLPKTSFTIVEGYDANCVPREYIPKSLEEK